MVLRSSESESILEREKKRQRVLLFAYVRVRAATDDAF